jgi:hypothetical protein
MSHVEPVEKQLIVNATAERAFEVSTAKAIEALDAG